MVIDRDLAHVAFMLTALWHLVMEQFVAHCYILSDTHLKLPLCFSSAVCLYICVPLTCLQVLLCVIVIADLAQALKESVY